jgi:outer membrane scaffolding protein for murein synthesis (MipA/OmpV family)
MRFHAMIAAALVAAPLAAQVPRAAETPLRPLAPGPQKPWNLTIGTAALASPVWQGSRDYGLSLVPVVALAYKDVAFLSVQDGLGWNAVNQNGWKLGPLIKPRFSRRESTGGSPFLLTGGSTALRGLGDVGTAGEAGGFAQYAWSKNRARIRAEVRQGFGGHDGLVVDTLAGWSDRSGNFLYSISARATFAGAGFLNTYYGVNARQSLASGLPQYRTDGGLLSTGLAASLSRPLGPRGRDGVITFLTSYDRLGDAAADSSLVQRRGRRDQFVAGLSYAYRFSWN